MTIAGMRKGDVINEWIAEDQPEKQPRAGTVFAQSASQPPQGQYRKKQNHDIAKRRWRGILCGRGASAKIINKSLQAAAQKHKVIVANERDCPGPPCGHLRDLA